MCFSLAHAVSTTIDQAVDEISIRASYSQDTIDNDNAKEQTHKMGSDNEQHVDIEPEQLGHDQPELHKSDDDIDIEESGVKEENSAEELLSRLHNILDDTQTADSQNSKSYDFLRQSCDPAESCDTAEGDVTDGPEQVPAGRNSVTSVSSGEILYKS